MKVLIIESNTEMREMLEFCLKKENYKTISTNSGSEALKIIKSFYPDLLIIDLNIKELDGETMVSLIRESPDKYGDPYIITLTSKDCPEMIIKSFESGTDDCIKKPFDMKEVCCKIKAIKTRLFKNKTHLYKYKTLILDPMNRKILENNEDIKLSKKEYDLLFYLVINENRILTRSKLMFDVWYKEYIEGERSVDACIKRVRKKVKTIKEDIVTIKGVGYKLKKQLG